MTCHIQLKGTDGEPCPVVLAKPQSYMNTSGGPLSKLMRELGVLAPEILVVHDEVDLSQGEVRVKCGGGLNAHNGLRSIADKLGTRDFARVRVGIGRPPGRMSVADYALRQLKGSFHPEALRAPPPRRPSLLDLRPDTLHMIRESKGKTL